MSGSASAGTQQAGTIGTANDLVDVNAEDIDAVSISTEELTNGIVGSGNSVTNLQGTFSTVALDTDTDDTNPLALSASGLSNPTLRIVVEAEHVGSSAIVVQMTLNNVTSTSYDFTQIDTSVSSPATDSKFDLVGGFGANTPVRGAFVIGAADAEGNTRIEFPTVSQEFTASNFDVPTLYKGEVADNSAFPVTSVQLSTGQNATGKLYVQELIR
jgi:hypothetical protein